MPRNYLVFALVVLMLYSTAQYYGFSPFGPRGASSTYAGGSGGTGPRFTYK
jgi:hypothetical protein